MGNFAGALEYLEPAVELWPDEPAYQAALGWALYKQPQSDAERAREHLEIARAQAPDDPTTLYRLGLVLRSVGDEATGEEILAIFRGLHAEGRTLVVVTHSERVAEVAQRVVRIRDGQILDEVREVA